MDARIESGLPGPPSPGPEVRSLATSPPAVGDEPHRRMAELPTAPEDSPTGREPAAAHETPYTATACLTLWQAVAAVGPLCLRTALQALLHRLHRLLLEPPAGPRPLPGRGVGDRGARRRGRLLTIRTAEAVSAPDGTEGRPAARR